MGRGARATRFLSDLATAVFVGIVVGLSGLARAAPLGASPTLTSSLLLRSDNATTYPNSKISPAQPTGNGRDASNGQGGHVAPAQPLITLLPIHTSLCHDKSGTVDFDAAGGVIFRDHAKNGDDLSTLVTFLIPETYADRTCEIVLDLSIQQVSGSQRADLFTSSAPAWTDTTSWPQGNLRDKQIGRVLTSELGGRAVWEQAFYNGPEFACKDYAGQYLAGEVVPVGNDDFMAWRVGAEFSEGVKIIVW